MAKNSKAAGVTVCVAIVAFLVGMFVNQGVVDAQSTTRGVRAADLYDDRRPGAAVGHASPRWGDSAVREAWNDRHRFLGSRRTSAVDDHADVHPRA